MAQKGKKSDVLLSQGDIAGLCGCSQQYVSKICTLNEIEANEKGLYLLAEVLPPMFKNKDNDRLEAAKIRKAEADAELAEIELETRKRGLITTREALDLIRKPYTPIANFLQTLPYKLAPKCVGIKDESEFVKQTVEEIDRCQARLKNELQKI